METSANYTGQLDQNGKPIIDKSYYNNAIREKIAFYIDALHYNPDKLTANHMNAIYRHIQEEVFAPHSNQGYNNKCNISYTETNISILLDIYTSISSDFVVMPSMFGFSLLTGIAEETIKSIVTPAALEIVNNRREYIRNKLADNNLGVTVLANNDPSVGLLYTRQNAIETQAIRQGLSLSDLKPITDKQANT